MEAEIIKISKTKFKKVLHLPFARKLVTLIYFKY